MDPFKIWDIMHDLGFPGIEMVKKKKRSTCNAGDTGDVGSIPGLGRSSGEGNGTNILAWEIPWTEEPGGLQPTGLQRIGHDLATK